MANKTTTSWWINLLVYGSALGLLLAALQFSKLRLLTFGQSENWYIALVASLFAGLGIWAGLKWNQRQPEKSPMPATLSHSGTTIPEELGITPRELEVLEQMAQGKSNQEIADSLFVSLNTVKTHLSNLFSKLGVKRRTQAIQKAKSMGIIP